MDRLKDIFNNVFNYTYDKTYNYIYQPIINYFDKSINVENVEEIIEKLRQVQNNIKFRKKEIKRNIDDFLKKAIMYHKKNIKETSLYYLKLKKMNVMELQRLDKINFNLETQIFNIDSLCLSLKTAELLNGTALNIKNINKNLQLSKIEETMDELNTSTDINLELNDIFNVMDNDDIIDDEKLLESFQKEELDKYNTQFPEVPNNILQDEIKTNENEKINVNEKVNINENKKLNNLNQ